MESDDAYQINLAVLKAARPPNPEASNQLFAEHKARTLNRTLVKDKSPKGSVDHRVFDILQTINNHDRYVTTSSCSGRVLFLAYEAGGVAMPSGEGSADDAAIAEAMVLPDSTTMVGRYSVSHDGILDPQAYFDLEADPLRDVHDHLWLQVQPFTLDVACASVADAQRLVAIGRPFYGHMINIISAEREWRTVVGIIGQERIDMPITLYGQRVYTGSVEALARIVNAKLKKNWSTMGRFLQALREQL